MLTIILFQFCIKMLKFNLINSFNFNQLFFLFKIIKIEKKLKKNVITKILKKNWKKRLIFFKLKIN